jgi:hypothetical protein
MNIRLYTLVVILFWAASAAWLFTAKILPALQRGNPPDYRQEFAASVEEKPLAVGWEMFWNRRPVGYIVSQAFGTRDEPDEIRSFVHFQKIGLQEVMRDLLGGLSFLTQSMLGSGGDVPLNLTMATKLQMNWDSELQSFQTSVQADHHLDLLLLRGHRTDNDHLRLAVFAGDAAEPMELGPLSQEIPLPEKARFSDAFSPRSRMPGLRVGQKWTTPVIVPMGGANTVRLVETLVAAEEEIRWGERTFLAYRLEYRQSGGTGASQQVSGLAWVTHEGLIVRQELTLGSAKLRLERMSDWQSLEHAKMLHAGTFDKYLHRLQFTHDVAEPKFVPEKESQP